jgi:xanthine dehydrogenase accessory factor
VNNPIHVLEAAGSGVRSGARMAIAAVVAARGSTPQPPGALLCVDSAGRVTGTLGGGCVEADIRSRALQLAAAGEAGGVFTFELDHDHGYDDGMICGGEMDVLIQVLERPAQAEALRAAAAELRAGRDATLTLRASSPSGLVEYRLRLDAPPQLLIAGGGHIARVLAQLGQLLGYGVSVIDDRIEFANPQRFPAPMNPVVGDIAVTLRDWPIDARTYVVIVTRGHRHDEASLEAVLGSQARYIGMIGSRRKIQVIFDDLRARGASNEQLARVCAPIGLDIHAVSTEEIALSIAAQLTQVRRAGHPGIVEGPLPVVEATE